VISLRRVQWLLAFLLGGGVFFSASHLYALPEKQIRQLVKEAEDYEALSRWDKAREIYELLLGQKDPGLKIRDRYQEVVRRDRQVRRHQDASYNKEVLSVDYGQALRLATIINNTLLDGSVDKKKVDSAKLFKKGLEELDAALADVQFLRQHIPAPRHGDVPAFRAMLKKTRGEIGALSRKDAIKKIGDIALAAELILDMNPTVAVMEFACGACYAIDEYTVYLTPNQLRVLAQTLAQNEALSVGLYLRIQDNKIVVRDIALQSPAAATTINVNDEIISIDNQQVFNLNLDTVKKLLEGPIGTMVTVEVRSPGEDSTRTIELPRQAIPSTVFWGQRKNTPYWILEINSFADTTPLHIDKALQDMARHGAKGIILDLRKNSGGVVDSAIETARKFLVSGVVTTAQHQDSKFNYVYHAKNPDAVTLPLMVLVDNDTASAAEVLAGALKDNKRATLIGQTTYGKGCTQCVLRLPNATGGIPTGGMRLTVARFFSPKGVAYSGRGVIPNIFIDERMADSRLNEMADVYVERAVEELNRLSMPK
jgi:carboxyl-terminal processing protease